jgi:hypothetical protein
MPRRSESESCQTLRQMELSQRIQTATRVASLPRRYNPAHAAAYARMYMLIRDLQSRGKRT